LLLTSGTNVGNDFLQPFGVTNLTTGEHIPLADHIVVWHTDLDRVDALVARGREVQDPRLDERNFTPLADGPVMDHYNQMDPDREDELEMFVDYVAGKKVARGLDRDERKFNTRAQIRVPIDVCRCL
jgi:hypothetical protein